jgi:hypothetical protein
VSALNELLSTSCGKVVLERKLSEVQG